MMNEKKHIWILLSQYKDWRSRLIASFTGRGFTHASIGFDDNLDEFYSFNFKGMCTEHFKKRQERLGDIPAAAFQLEITDAEYEQIKNRIDAMLQNKKEYHYSPIGVILCVLHISHKIKNHYFCSQFVAELLKQSEVISKDLNPSVCLPGTLLRQLRENERICKVVYNPSFTNPEYQVS